ncbi:MAG: endonuclease [Clostridiales bacterium]|nr:endonuclease [Clostridiales bacterium]
MAKKVLKRVGIAAGVILGMVLLAAVGLIVWLTVTEYKPAPVEEAPVLPGHSKYLSIGDSLTILTQNTGYGGLGADSDFFMDGGRGVNPSRDQVQANLSGLTTQLFFDQKADIYFLQEVDVNSSRTQGINQSSHWHNSFLQALGSCSSSHALNYSCAFVPYPLPPIGKVQSGVQTLSAAPILSAQRVALPCPFSWPVSAANLKRCLLVSRVPLDDSDKELVLVNLHLEAYDDGEGKAAQTKALMDFLTAEYDKGNYVIAGGDFNQTFPGALDAFPIKDASLWAPGVLDADILPDGWQLAYDLSVPTCRLLNQPYDPDSGDTQFYVIDGFILSPNVRLDSAETLDRQFQYTDHNPVLIQVTLEA